LELAKQRGIRGFFPTQWVREVLGVCKGKNLAWKVKITLGRGKKRKRVEIFALESIHEERKRDKNV